MDTFTPISSLVLLFAALVAIIDFIRYVKAADANGAVTIFLAWLGGFALLAVAAQAQVTKGIVLVVDQPPLGDLDIWSIVLLGFVVGSLAPAGIKLYKAFDNTDSSGTPPLVG